jgi:4a-hydroxytetrahydrobiopterin dehydratase
MWTEWDSNPPPLQCDCSALPNELSAQGVLYYTTSMNNLTQQKCVPCEGGVEPLKRVEFEKYLEQVAQWRVLEDKELEREFKFKDFNEALGFVNRVGEIAEQERHHPDLYLHGWNKLRINLMTHAIGGLSINDFVMAAKIDQMSAS